jgi:N-acylglucosamine 2-epimerase
MATSKSNQLGHLSTKYIDELIAVYRDGLLEDTIPFWMKNCVDQEFGGFTFCLDRDGSVIDTDKGMWHQGRFTWTLSHLYNNVEERDDWLQLAQHGVDFIRKFGFDDDGRMWFQVTRDGRPIRKRRYTATETFATIALAEYGRAAQDESALHEALDLYKLIIHYQTNPGLLLQKFTETRPMKSIGFPMIMINTSQTVRAATGDPICDEWIDRSITEIKRDFMKPDLEVVMETVGPNGEIYDHFDGRTLNPGHAIEAAWFILQEAKYRDNDHHLIELGTTILDWMWVRGWDQEYGGIFYFRDLKGLPVQEYWHDMKFWWPHNEAIIATLMAYQLTGNEKYALWHQMVHDWAYNHFPDPEFGEWYGYLHRDGRISHHMKGNIWKGPFHLPRMQYKCWKILEEMKRSSK